MACLSWPSPAALRPAWHVPRCRSGRRAQCGWRCSRAIGRGSQSCWQWRPAFPARASWWARSSSPAVQCLRAWPFQCRAPSAAWQPSVPARRCGARILGPVHRPAARLLRPRNASSAASARPRRAVRGCRKRSAPLPWRRSGWQPKREPRANADRCAGPLRAFVSIGAPRPAGTSAPSRSRPECR